jgi:hypothetical protein
MRANRDESRIAGFTAHAMSCGINMEGRVALPVAMADGRWCAHDINHPESGNTIIPQGWYMNRFDMDKLIAMGVDYVVVDADPALDV